MEDFVSPKQVASALGVSESAIKRWCDRGLMQPQRTAGGHRRLLVSEVLEFLRQNRHALIRPEVLGLPVGTTNAECKRDVAAELFQGALSAGREECVRRIAFGLFVHGESLAGLCDHYIAPAMHAVGDQWSRGECELFVERRACNIALRLLHELRSLVACPKEGAPVAIGGALSGDHYSLPTAMVDLTVREAGWKAQDLGVDLPAAALGVAVAKIRPRMVWVSVSHVADEEKFLAEYSEFYRAAEECRVAVAVGGQALHPCMRKRMRYCSHCDTLEQLGSFGRTMEAGAARCDQV